MRGWGHKRASSRRVRDKQVGWDQVSGAKVYARKLKEDGWRRGIFTVDPDPPHPQDYLVPPGPDMISRGPVYPPQHQLDVIVVPGTGVGDDLVTLLSLPVMRIAGRSPLTDPILDDRGASVLDDSNAQVYA